MPQFNEAELTAAVVKSFENTPDPRAKFLLQELVKSLHDYVRKTDLTFEEWEYAIDFLTRTGQKCTPIRQEFILLSDTLGVSMLVDAINHRRRARMVDLTRELLDDSVVHRRVGVLGAAFKPNSDDIRDSPALDVAAIGGDAGQIEQRQRPVRIHRLGRQQLAFGRVDAADPLQRHRAQPPTRHPRRARHRRLQQLGEHAERGRTVAAGAERLDQ